MPGLICELEVTRYLWAANALPEAAATTRASATAIVNFFKKVPFSVQAGSLSGEDAGVDLEVPRNAPAGMHRKPFDRFVA